MIDALTTFINNAGWLAPLYYILSFVVTALVPVLPTPLVAALGGTAFGYGPAVVYGILGMGLGALVSLALARGLGRPLLQRLVKPEVWAAWEQLLGIRSVAVWGLIFLVLNLDFAVVASGLTTLPILHLWIAAVLARTPWLIASAWFGDAILVNDSVVLVIGLLMIPALYLLGRLRPVVQTWLIRLTAEPHSRSGANGTSNVPQARIENVADSVPEKVEAHH